MSVKRMVICNTSHEREGEGKKCQRVYDERHLSLVFSRAIFENFTAVSPVRAETARRASENFSFKQGAQTHHRCRRYRRALPYQSIHVQRVRVILHRFWVADDVRLRHRIVRVYDRRRARVVTRGDRAECGHQDREHHRVLLLLLLSIVVVVFRASSTLSFCPLLGRRKNEARKVVTTKITPPNDDDDDDDGEEKYLSFSICLSLLVKVVQRVVVAFARSPFRKKKRERERERGSLLNVFFPPHKRVIKGVPCW